MTLPLRACLGLCDVFIGLDSFPAHAKVHYKYSFSLIAGLLGEDLHCIN